MMLALVYHGPEDLRAESIERPSPRGGEVLVKVAACGVCGTDQRIYSGAHRAYGAGVRRVPGHEIVGEIVDVGQDAPSDLPRGTVVVAPNYGCSHCDQCLSGNNNRCSAMRALGMTENGGFAEYVLVPAAAVAQGNLLAFAEAEPSLGVLVEPLATVIRGQDLLDIGPADTVMVVGGGPIGALHVALARLKGAARIILSDHWDNRLAVGRQVGADVAINPRIENIAETVARETNGKGADVIILAAPSHQAQADAMRLAATGGRVSFFAGLPKDRPSTEIETNLIHYKELRVSGTTACSTLNCRRAASLMLAGRMDLSPLLTLDLPLASGVSAFGKSAGRDQLKVTLRT